MPKIVRPYRVRSWLICDDVRIENNGKYILVGVYSGDIVLRKPLPVTLAMLAFWIQLDLQKANYGSYELRLLDPQKRQAAQFRGSARFTRADEPGVLICLTGPITLSNYGSYNVEFGIDGPPQLLGAFGVRSSEGDASFKPTAKFPALGGISRQH